MNDARTIDAAIATTGAGVVAALMTLTCLFMPARVLEALVVHSGVAGLVNAAAPPLGFTARLLLTGITGLLVGAIGWAVLVLVVGERRIAVRAPGWRPRVRLAVRRSDSHRDAPPRPPILATRELGVPFLSIVAAVPAPDIMPAIGPAVGSARFGGDAATDGQGLPDFDTPLAALDPGAIPEMPREPARVVPSLVATPPPYRPVPLAPGERIDSVELGVAVRDRPDSIEALLSRLERGTRRRSVGEAVAVAEQAAAGPAPSDQLRAVPPKAEVAEPVPVPSGSLAETLGQLRRLATRG